MVYLEEQQSSLRQYAKGEEAPLVLEEGALGSYDPSGMAPQQASPESTQKLGMDLGARGLGHHIHLKDKFGLSDDEVHYYEDEKDEAFERALEQTRTLDVESRFTRFRRRIHDRLKHHRELALKGFHDVSMWDPSSGSNRFTRQVHPLPRMRRLVVNSYFEWAMTLLIVANCVIIGWQAELRNPEGVTKVINTVVEHLFTSLFFLELVMRLIVFNWTYFFDSENHLDIFLVTLSVLNSWVLVIFNIKADILRKASVLRILRLVRIARNFRRQFKEMWQLLRGLVDSFETLIWAYVMMLCVLYMFGIAATTAFSNSGTFDSDATTKPIVKEYFDDVLLSMLTLFQVMTLDSWTSISRPLTKVQAWSELFFVVFISVSVFLLLNLITAVIVDQAFVHGREDKEEREAELEKEKEVAIKDLITIFKEIDRDKSGMIDQGELARAWKRPKVRSKFRTMDITKKDLLLLWTALDNGDGELTIEEFVNGMRKLKGEAKAKDILKLYREVRILEEAIKEIEVLSDYCKEKMRNIQMKLRVNFREMDATRRTLKRVKEMSSLAAKSQAFTKPKT